MDEIILKTSVSDTSKIRVNLNNNIYDKDGVCIEGIQELCPIDSNTRKLRTVDSTLFPADIELVEKLSDIDYTKFNFDINEFILAKTVEINLSNVDFYMHTNNVEYVRFCLSVLEPKLFESKEIDTFEIHYIRESVVGDNIDIYVSQNGNVIDYILVNNDEVITKAELVLKDK